MFSCTYKVCGYSFILKLELISDNMPTEDLTLSPLIDKLDKLVEEVYYFRVSNININKTTNNMEIILQGYIFSI